MEINVTIFLLIYVLCLHNIYVQWTIGIYLQNKNIYFCRYSYVKEAYFIYIDDWRNNIGIFSVLSTYFPWTHNGSAGEVWAGVEKYRYIIYSYSLHETSFSFYSNCSFPLSFSPKVFCVLFIFLDYCFLQGQKQSYSHFQ